MPSADNTQVQLSFGGGLDAQSAAHLVSDVCVAAATNIDFSLEPGAPSVRRGCVKLWTINTGAITSLYRNYNTASLQSSPYYAFTADQQVYRGVSGSFTAILSGVSAGGKPASYRQHAFFNAQAGSLSIKDDGTVTTDWPVFGPSSAPTLTIDTATNVIVANTYTVPEGALTTQASGTCTADADVGTFRIQFLATPLSTNLNTNGANLINNFGTHFVDMQLSNPSVITRISADYSIGDASFVNYFHSELNPTNFQDGANTDPSVLIADMLTIGTGATPASAADKTNVSGLVGVNSLSTPLSIGLNGSPNSFTSWAYARTNFGLVNSSNAPADWTNIGAVRLIVEATAVVTVELRNWRISGSEGFPLTDADFGYAYWQTYAKLDASGNLLNESAPSPATARIKCQAAAIEVADGVTSLSSVHDLTHKIVYRQGGFLQSPYAVGTYAISTATFTDTVNDIAVLSIGNEMETDLLPAQFFPGNGIAAADSFYDRIFTADSNFINWSLPGEPGSFPAASRAQVSHTGDDVKGMIVQWPTLVIVNRDSIYELQGSVFEGPNQDWTLQRANSLHGCFAPGCIIKTPFGIPLLNYDGLSMYMPGQGVDTPASWVMEKMADAFRGNGPGDPAAIKGNRIPAINLGPIQNSCAAYGDEKLYIGCPCGTATDCNVLFVINHRTKQIQNFTYPFNFRSLLFDQEGCKLLCGTTDGTIMQLETGEVDGLTTSGSQGIVWNVLTREWTAPTDSVLENLAVEYVGTGRVRAILDNTSTLTLGTLSSTNRAWLEVPFLGTVARSAQFAFDGTRSTGVTGLNSIYGLGFDALVEPKRLQFFKTDYTVQDAAGESLWDVFYADLEIVGTGSVLGTVFVDGVAAMTATISQSGTGRRVFDQSFPARTYGRVGNVIYNASGSTFFKHWSSEFDRRPEPPRVNFWRSDVTALEENICDAVDCDINPNGTATLTVFVDNVATSTFAVLGTNQQSYTFALPNEVYGRTIYAIYNGNAIKVYKTWFHQRPEPDRWTNYVSDREDAQHAFGASSHEAIWDALDCDVNTLGNTVLATVMVDGTAVSTATITGNTGRDSYAFALPNETYGRMAWVVYNVQGGGTFKHFKTWWTYRPEPDRLTNYVSDRESGKEHFWHRFESDINTYGNTVLATVMVDNIAVNTYALAAATRQSFAYSFPVGVYGRTVWAIYNAASGKFKHYKTAFEGEQEPDRLNIVEINKIVFPSTHYIKTWSAEINPLGTAVGILYSDGVALMTATFTGTNRDSFDTGLDVDLSLNIQTASQLSVTYQGVGGTTLKHYDTNFETLPKPFGKRTWSVEYWKVGGASQLDLGRFYSLDVEVSSGTATLTSIWDLDGVAFQTNTLVFSQSREWRDRLAFSPGARGYLFQQRLLSDVPVKIWAGNIDTQRVGIKGLGRISRQAGAVDGKAQYAGAAGDSKG